MTVKGKRFKLPKSLKDVSNSGGKITGTVKITRHNVITILENMDKKRRRQKLRKCYSVLRKETGRKGMLAGYGWQGIIAEMGKFSGLSRDTIKRQIYKKRRKKLEKCG
jgi:hypothetical protein